jgi:hypothetical protein
MAAATGLRDDYDGSGLRTLAKASKNPAQGQRLLALAEIYDGARRGGADWRGGTADGARLGLRFNVRGSAGLIDGKAPGNASKFDKAQRLGLAKLSRAARSWRSTGWFAGGWRIWRSGCVRSSRS